MSDDAATSFDGWTDSHHVGVPPIRLGSAPVGEPRWLRLGDPEPVSGLSIGGIASDLERHRGYHDRHSQGGGLSLFLASVPLALALRHVLQQPVPRLDPADTWCRISEFGNPREVIISGAPPCEHLDMSEFALHLHALMDPSFAAIRAHTGFSVVAQWAQFTSGLADVLLSVPIVAESRALAYLEELTAVDSDLRRSRPRIGHATWRNRQRPYATRRVCCFNYRGTNGAYCLSLCPLVPEPERRRNAVETWSAVRCTDGDQS